MNASGPLEGRYRRLLAIYPAGHRRQHQDEMLGVLMTGARAGQQRPGLADTADLIWGALLIRLRPARRGTAWPLWRDALAVVSLLLPLIVLAYSALLRVALLVSLGAGTAIFGALARSDAEFLGGWMIVTVLALLRLRRTTAAAAAALLAWLAYSYSSAVNWSYIDPASMVFLAAAGLELGALLASPGPRRAMEITSWKHYALAVAIPLGLAATWNWVGPSHPAVSDSIMIAACAMTLSGMAVASALSQRAGVLLALPVYYLVVELLVPPSVTGGRYQVTSGWEGPLRVTMTVLPFAVLACVALTAALRAARHARGGRRAA